MKQLLHCMMQVQNLVTLLLTLGFLHLSITGRLAADQFLTIYCNLFGQESRAASPAFPPSRA